MSMFTSVPYPTYDILLSYGQLPTLGLLDNMVYDVIPSVPSAQGEVMVNASIYDVQCSALPGAQQSPPFTLKAGSGFNDPSIVDILTYVVDSAGTQVTINPPCASAVLSSRRC